MKIVYPFCNNGIGGAEIYAIYLAKEAQKNGHEVKFILSKEGDLSTRLTREKLVYDIIPMESSFNLKQMLKSVINLSIYFKNESVDIVHTQMLREHSLAIGAKIFGSQVKVVRTFHRLDQFNWKMLPILWLYRLKTDRIIALTEYLEKYLNKNGFRNNITLIYNGVPAVKVGSHDKAIGYMGRIAKEKGILQFVKDNKDAFVNEKLIIGGEGADRKELENLLITEKVKGIEFVGRIDNHEEYYSKISVYILPSASEVLPLNVLESFSSGIPVVTFDLPSLEGIVTPENGVIVKDSYKEMAKKAIQLLHDSNSLNQKSNAAKRDYKEKYTIDKMWQKTEMLYKQLLKY